MMKPKFVFWGIAFVLALSYWLDKTNKIISGKFEFAVPEMMTGEACKEVKITEGFFDVKY